MHFVLYVSKHYVLKWHVSSFVTSLLCIHQCHLLDTKILYLNFFWNFLLHTSVSLSSFVGFHLQPCRKGWDLHHSRWSSSSSCNCMCYPMGAFWAYTKPSTHMWFSAWYPLLLLWRSVFGQWSKHQAMIDSLFLRETTNLGLYLLMLPSIACLIL